MGFECSCLNPSVTNLNSGLNKAASFLNPHFGTKPSNMTSYLPNILSKSWGEKNLVYKRDTSNLIDFSRFTSLLHDMMCMHCSSKIIHKIRHMFCGIKSKSRLLKFYFFDTANRRSLSHEIVISVKFFQSLHESLHSGCKIVLIVKLSVSLIDTTTHEMRMRLHKDFDHNLFWH